MKGEIRKTKCQIAIIIILKVSGEAVVVVTNREMISTKGPCYEAGLVAGGKLAGHRVIKPLLLQVEISFMLQISKNCGKLNSGQNR